MGKRFDEFIQHKKEIGVLYQHTFAGNDICGNCIYRRPWQNLCSKFKKKVFKKEDKQMVDFIIYLVKNV